MDNSYKILAKNKMKFMTMSIERKAPEVICFTAAALLLFQHSKYIPILKNSKCVQNTAFRINKHFPFLPSAMLSSGISLGFGRCIYSCNELREQLTRAQSDSAQLREQLTRAQAASNESSRQVESLTGELATARSDSAQLREQLTRAQAASNEEKESTESTKEDETDDYLELVDPLPEHQVEEAKQQNSLKRLFLKDESLSKTSVQNILECLLAPGKFSEKIIYLGEVTDSDTIVERASIEELKKEIKNLYNKDVKSFFIPLFLNNNRTARHFSSRGRHFACLYLDLEKKILDYYDPKVSRSKLLPQGIPQFYQQLERRLTKNELISNIEIFVENEFNIRVTTNENEIVHQKDDFNCGRFMIKFILEREQFTSIEEYAKSLEEELKNPEYFTNYKNEISKKLSDE